MQNAFVAALLQTAAEHRLKAERARSLMDPWPERTRGPLGDAWRQMLKHMNDSLEKEAREADGLAEVYQSFADKIIAEVAGTLILQEVTRLFEPAELLPVEFKPAGDLIPRQWQLQYMQFYRGMDLYNPRFWTGNF